MQNYDHDCALTMKTLASDLVFDLKSINQSINQSPVLRHCLPTFCSRFQGSLSLPLSPLCLLQRDSGTELCKHFETIWLFWCYINKIELKGPSNTNTIFYFKYFFYNTSFFKYKPKVLYITNTLSSILELLQNNPSDLWNSTSDVKHSPVTDP